MTARCEGPAFSSKLACPSCRAPQLRRQQCFKQRLPRSRLLCRPAKGSIQVTIQSPAGEELHVDKVSMELQTEQSVLCPISTYADSLIFIQDFFSIGSAGGSDLLLQGKQGRQVLAWLLCQPPLQQYCCDTKPVVTTRTLPCTISKLTRLLDDACSLHQPTGRQEVNTYKYCAVAEEHACIEVKKGRLYCTALVGDPENFMDETFTWLNESELRPGQP